VAQGLQDYLIDRPASGDMVDGHGLTLSLSPRSGDELLVQLVIPGYGVPDDMSFCALQIKTVSDRLRLGEKDR
jgi:hypothetical protein